MSEQDHVYKTVELTGTSRGTMEDAVQNALSRASATLRNMRWFQIVEYRGSIDGGSVSRWQVTLKVGFTLEP